MVGAAKTTAGAQRQSLRTLRKDYHKRKADLRKLVKARKTAMDNIRADISNLETEIKEANEELSVDFDSGSSLFPSSDSGSSSTDSSSKESAAKPSKGKSQPSKKGAVTEGDNKQGQRRKRRPFLAPGAPAPNHRGVAQLQRRVLPGFRRRRPAALPGMRTAAPWFSQRHKGTPSEGHALPMGAAGQRKLTS